MFNIITKIIDFMVVIKYSWANYLFQETLGRNLRWLFFGILMVNYRGINTGNQFKRIR